MKKLIAIVLTILILPISSANAGESYNYLFEPGPKSLIRLEQARLDLRQQVKLSQCDSTCSSMFFILKAKEKSGYFGQCSLAQENKTGTLTKLADLKKIKVKCLETSNPAYLEWQPIKK